MIWSGAARHFYLFALSMNKVSYEIRSALAGLAHTKKIEKSPLPCRNLPSPKPFQASSMSMRQQRPRAAKTAAMKKIAAICAYEQEPLPEPVPIKTYQFPFTPDGPETYEETAERLRAQMKYYKKHPYIGKKPIIVRFLSYLRGAFRRL
jgi:hypothetical protein